MRLHFPVAMLMFHSGGKSDIQFSGNNGKINESLKHRESC